MFSWRESDEPDRPGATVWATFEEGTDYFGTSGQQWMINYRVDDLDGLLEQLKREGVRSFRTAKSTLTASSPGSSTPTVTHRALGAAERRQSDVIAANRRAVRQRSIRRQWHDRGAAKPAQTASWSLLRRRTAPSAKARPMSEPQSCTIGPRTKIERAKRNATAKKTADGGPEVFRFKARLVRLHAWRRPMLAARDPKTIGAKLHE